MHDTELFPLEAVPSRVKFAILCEFKGRRPTVREVDRICDKSWLAVPGIGRSALASIRQATEDHQSLSVDASFAGMSDAELLTCLDALQEELQKLSKALSSALASTPENGVRSRRMKRMSSADHRHQGSRITL